MKTEVTALELETEIRAIVQESPYTVYSTPVIDNAGNKACVYFDAEGNPSCLIGHGLAKLGITLEDMSDSENLMAIAVLLNDWNSTPASETCWLRNVQAYQDCGETWDGAVKKSDKRRAEGDG